MIIYEFAIARAQSNLQDPGEGAPVASHRRDGAVAAAHAVSSLAQSWRWVRVGAKQDGVPLLGLAAAIVN
jgi:hypothetical protein